MPEASLRVVFAVGKLFCAFIRWRVNNLAMVFLAG